MRHVHPVGRRFVHYVLSVLCIGCSFVLILLSLNGRTVWAEGSAYSPNAATIRDAAGWDWLARGTGLLAIISLGVGLHTSRRWLAITCTALATACLGWAAYVAWHFSTDISQGLVERAGWTVRTPEHVGMASQVAALASAVGFLLLLNLLASYIMPKRITAT